ncbi:hypothetical protein HNQ91_001739 [Filimonas zeae]|uniref:CBU-0592-like domain-containing protein n=1 Tax=Filimonas zeae TaxID=1737353 RepID=A0A917IWX3_9BACT|nr:hypothetical protein [Filimonas zeae]MDR6338688.1 hypothetical protein [Filimonas zeae]GGH67049.1 hypothetical protein GCM10011379_21890 [Filimonas zeae]
MVSLKAIWCVSTFVPSVAGWIGTLSYLLAYLLLSTNKLKVNQRIYHLLNIVGAFGLTWNAITLNDYPNIIVNVSWALIASWAIFNIQHTKKS